MGDRGIRKVFGGFFESPKKILKFRGFEKWRIGREVWRVEGDTIRTLTTYEKFVGVSRAVYFWQMEEYIVNG